MAPKKQKKEKAAPDSRFKGWAVKYGLLIFISAWMFVLGVLVGRGTAPVKFKTNNLSEELLTLKEADIRQQMTRIKTKTEDSKAKTNLDFYQELKKNKKPVKKTPNPKNSLKRTTVKQRPQSSEEKTAVKQTDGRTKPKSKSVKKPVVIDLPAPDTAKAQKADSTVKTLTIQAASLKNRSEAVELVKKLNQKGYSAYKTVAVVPNKGVWFRVRIGEFNNKTEAASTMKRLKKDGFKPILLQK
jgi:cell division protein FtsN